MPHRGARTARLECLARLHADAHAGKRAVEFLPAARICPTRRVVDEDAAALETAHDDKVVCVPVHDAGKRRLLAQPLGLKSVRVDLHAQLLRRACDVARLGPVASHAAHASQLVEGDPLAPVGAYHGKAGRPALDRLHLHDLRHAAGRLTLAARPARLEKSACARCLSRLVATHAASPNQEGGGWGGAWPSLCARYMFRARPASRYPPQRPSYPGKTRAGRSCRTHL